MKRTIRMTISAAIVVAISASQIPAVLAQTADLRLTTTINVGAGTGGADQLAVIVEIDTDVDFDIGTSAFRFFYNEPALDIPSGVSGGNQALVDGTDYEFLAGFQAGQFYFSNSVTTQGQLDRISANLGLANGAPTGTTIAAAAGWVQIVRLFFDIVDDAQTEGLVWVVPSDPNPSVIFLEDNATGVAVGLLTGSDKSLDPLMAVELSTFASVVNDGSATVRWTTASEFNSAGFAVEVAPKATGDFNQVGYVAGAGTSDSPQNYAFALDGLDAGVYRVRLKQVNLDGSFDYSPELEVSIQLGEAYRLGEAYPSPFATSASFTLSVRDPQPVQIDVFNLLGQKVQSVFDGELGGNQSRAFTIDGASLSNGIYIVRAKGASFAATSTVAVLK